MIRLRVSAASAFDFLMGPPGFLGFWLTSKLYRLPFGCRSESYWSLSFPTMRRPEMTVVRAAAVQMSPVLYSREGTVDKVIRQLLELGRQGVQFATFPET